MLFMDSVDSVSSMRVLSASWAECKLSEHNSQFKSGLYGKRVNFKSVSGKLSVSSAELSSNMTSRLYPDREAELK